MGIATAPKLLDRGVWWADYLVDGYNVLLAITSAGECIRRVRMRPGVNEDLVRAFLNGLLDHYDPERPRLALVKPTLSPPTFSRPLFLPLLRSKTRRS